MKRLYHYPAMIVLALLAALFAVIFEVCTFFSLVLMKPEIYSEAMGSKGVSDAIYEDLNTYFEHYAAPTGIPKEVFTKSLDKSELSKAAYQLLSDSLAYLSDPNAVKPEPQYDFTQLDKDITDYIEANTDHDKVEDKDEYNKLVENTISTAEGQIKSRLDVMMLYTLSKTGFAAKVHTCAGYIRFGAFASAAAAVIFLAAMVIVDRRHPRDLPYWFGCTIFSASTLVLVPSLYLQKVHFFDRFFVKSDYIYRTVTGLCDTALDHIITAQTIALMVGILLILLTLVIHAIYLKYLRRRSRSS